jgi:hypothetical protein
MLLLVKMSTVQRSNPYGEASFEWTEEDDRNFLNPKNVKSTMTDKLNRIKSIKLMRVELSRVLSCLDIVTIASYCALTSLSH